MSKNPVFEPPTLEQEIQKDNDLAICKIKTINIQLELLRDNIYNNIIKALQNLELSNHIWITKSNNYFINENQILMYKHLSKGQSTNLTTLPNNRINKNLNDSHDRSISGHLGVDKTYNKIIERYFWPTIYKDIRKYVTSCISYQKRKSDKTTMHCYKQKSIRNR
uniref:Integrase zinc-binding domain-containing protein n=1 Tax=Sipha flava TaxID=143950 RepID=A0A2S2PXT1_9HEMI